MAVNHAEFHRRLLRLVKTAHNDGGLCPACVCQELVGALEALIVVADITPAALEQHGIDTWLAPAPDTPLTPHNHIRH